MPQNLSDYEEARLLELSILNTDKVALLRIAGTESTLGTEVVGGDYARATASFGAAAIVGSGPTAFTAKTTNAPHLYINMPATEIQGWAILDTAGHVKWSGLFQESIVSAVASADTLGKVAHGLANDQRVVFASGYTPAGLTANQTYYVIDTAADTFKVSATLGGAAVDITADMTGAVVGKVTLAAAGEVFAIPSGSLQLSLG